MALTHERLIAFLKDSLDLGDDLDADSPLFSTGALDSVAMLNLIAFVEEASGLDVRADDVTLDNFDTVAQIVRFAEACPA